MHEIPVLLRCIHSVRSYGGLRPDLPKHPSGEVPLALPNLIPGNIYRKIIEVQSFTKCPTRKFIRRWRMGCPISDLVYPKHT